MLTGGTVSLPGDFAFRFALGVRDRLYRAGILRTQRLDYPVISVGNLTLGGTGKTPLTILLAQKLHEHGFRPVVLSRGYGRRSRGTLIVSRGWGPGVRWEDSGDEPYVISERLAGVASVVVGKSRYLAGLTAQREQLGNIFLLDDGFQHRPLYRNVDIVTIDPEEWVAGEALLPNGRWREPKHALSRAHAACVQNLDRSFDLELPVPAFRMHLEAEGIYRDNRRVAVEELRGKSITAFAGIAKPQRFFSKLESLGLRLDQRLPFPDHHRFTSRDLRRLTGDVRITTEKDIVKLKGHGDFFVLRVSVKIAEFDRLKDLIFKQLTMV